MITTQDKSQRGATIQVEPFRKHIRKTKPHKHHKYFELVFLDKGSGWHSIDHRTYEVQPPVLFFIRKEQVHHWDLTSEPGGYVLIMKKDFFDNGTDPALISMLTQVSQLTALPLPSQTALPSLFHLLEQTVQLAPTYRQEAIEGLLKTLFAHLLEHAATKRPSPLPGMDTFQTFQALLIEPATLQNSVAYYAEQLNTSPQNLNAICRQQVDQSASEFIAHHIISEAKRYLDYSAQSISEIAYLLNFKDPSHFIKYFKRHAGLTPQAFRLRDE